MLLAVEQGGDMSIEVLDSDSALIAPAKRSRRGAARHYDALAPYYNAIDRIECVPPALRRQAADVLCAPHPAAGADGRRFLEAGVGTGLNMPFIAARLAPDDAYLGIDISLAMLERAKRLRRTRSWNNMRLEQLDAAEYCDPAPLDGILCSLCLNVIPEHEQVMEQLWQRLRPGGSFVILEVEPPKGLLWEIAAPVLDAVASVGFRSDMRKEIWRALDRLCPTGTTTARANWGYYLCYARKG